MDQALLKGYSIILSYKKWKYQTNIEIYQTFCLAKIQNKLQTCPEKTGNAMDILSEQPYNYSKDLKTAISSYNFVKILYVILINDKDFLVRTE